LQPHALHVVMETAMSSEPFKAKIYVMEGCPFSFKLWLFLVEAGLADQVEVIRCDPQAPDADAIRARLSAGLGRPATFPTAEVEPGRYEADSDALIRYFATRHGIDAERLPALAFYKQTIFPQIVALHEHK